MGFIIIDAHSHLWLKQDTVVQKKMRQWCLRVSAYAQRLLDGLETVDWTDSLKETQRNWPGLFAIRSFSPSIYRPPIMKPSCVCRASRSDDNPNGFTIEGFTIIENKDQVFC